MKRSKQTKRALTSSVLALVLCFVMLLGTTFAWFTDNASTNVNKVEAGTLDVALEMKQGDNWVSAEGRTLDFVKATGHENEEILWEPGCTYKLPKLRVVNNGNLALKYKVVISGVVGDANLAEVLDVYYTHTALNKSNEHIGTLSRYLNSADPDGAAYGTLAANANSGEFSLKLHMQEAAGNQYQGESIEGIVVTIYATQDTVEYDSNNNTYDADAGFDFAWDGSADPNGLATNTDTTAKTVKIENAAQLKAFADAVKDNNNTYFGYTVTLTADIDLSGQTWPGIGANNYTNSPSYFFNGTFDGQGHTIYNMTVSNLVGNISVAGFFNGLGNNAIVKNLNFDNASVTSNHEAGVVAGYCNYTAGNGVVAEPRACIENCHVTNSTVTSVAHNASGAYDDGDKAGGIVGFMYYDVKNCSVKNTTIQGVRDLGGIVGIGYGSVSDCSIVDVTIVRDTSKIDNNSNIDSIVGRKESGNSIINCTGAATKTTLTSVTSSNASEVTTALKSTAETINVTLTGDVALTISDLGTITDGSGQYKLGGAGTKAINIDLGGHKLTLNTTYWSALGATNSEAVITVKNGSMNSSQTTGTWNSYDLTFYDCDWKFENVTFDKAVALATGADTTMTNVVINESNSVAAAYALWITAEGQNVTLNNVTIKSNGGCCTRAIAIKDQYVTNKASVTLSISNSSISSAKKAAVLVTSTAGATITASNVDISGVSADSTNLVWVDNGTGYGNTSVVTLTVDGVSKNAVVES